MSENRIRDYLTADGSVGLMTAPTEAAFVPCPSSLFAFAGFSAPQINFVAEVYRLARELTEAQLRKPARTFPPAFSMN